MSLDTSSSASDCCEPQHPRSQPSPTTKTTTHKHPQAPQSSSASTSATGTLAPSYLPNRDRTHPDKPTPLTGHDLMLLFPTPSPWFIEKTPGSCYFGKQERAFFAQPGKEIVRAQFDCELDLFRRLPLSASASTKATISPSRLPIDSSNTTASLLAASDWEALEIQSPSSPNSGHPRISRSPYSQPPTLDNGIHVSPPTDSQPPVPLKATTRSPSETETKATVPVVLIDAQPVRDRGISQMFSPPVLTGPPAPQHHVTTRRPRSRAQHHPHCAVYQTGFISMMSSPDNGKEKRRIKRAVAIKGVLGRRTRSCALSRGGDM